VEQPDTLETLAAAYHITTAQLQEMNPTVDFVNLYIGQLIKVPLLEENTTANGATTNYIVQEGDSRSAIAERYGMTLEELEQLNPE
jgi:LysM repeat protein